MFSFSSKQPRQREGEDGEHGRNPKCHAVAVAFMQSREVAAIVAQGWQNRR